MGRMFDMSALASATHLAPDQVVSIRLALCCWNLKPSVDLVNEETQRFQVWGVFLSSSRLHSFEGWVCARGVMSLILLHPEGFSWFQQFVMVIQETKHEGYKLFIETFFSMTRTEQKLFSRHVQAKMTSSGWSSKSWKKSGQLGH